MKIKKVINRGELIPRYYGIAYQEDTSLQWFCYPLGLNVIVGLWKALIWSLKSSFAYPSQKALRDASYREGYIKGRQDAAKDMNNFDTSMYVKR